MDLEILYALQNARTPFTTAIMNGCTYLASEVLIVVVLCGLYWCLNKEFAYKLCFSYFVSGLAIQGLKVIFRVPRPWIRDSRLFPDETAAPDATGYSFPSGHTQTATSLYGAFAFHVKKWWSFVIGFVVIFLVMFSRMFLGCHTPQDVGVSFAISIVLVIVVNTIFNKVKFDRKKRLVVALLVELASIAVIVYTCIAIEKGLIAPDDYKNAYDAIKCAGAGVGFGIAYFLERSFVNFNPLQTKKVWAQILKFIIGLIVALAFKELPKRLLITETTGTSMIIAIHMIRYALTILWAIFIYPLIFTKVISKKK